MPEGPEVRRSTDHLCRLLVGKRIVNAFVGTTGRYVQRPPEGFAEFLGELRGRGACRVTEVDCKGKFMWWTMDFPRKLVGPERSEPPWRLWITYGMSGQWSSEQTKHAGFGINYNDSGSPLDATGNFVQPPALYFNDHRHFGTLKFVHSDELHQEKLASLGPDMLHNPPNEQQFRIALNRRNQKTLAEALMDQSCVSGVGNYVKAEALYLAELSPHRIVCELSNQEIERLRQQIVNVMKASYNTGGATISTYRNVDGSKGGMQRRFAVYGNQTDPIGNPVVKEETKDGRTTHWVPSVQH
jgi:DNA-formamidopyrimidine glycosylase